VLGVGLAYGGIRLFLSIAPEWFVRLREISIDARVLGFTAALSVVTGLLFGAAPALQGSKADLVESLKESARGASAGFIRQRLRSVLVTVEMALALVLLIGAGLMIRSFLRLSGAELGCDPRNVLTFQVRLARGEFVKDAGAIGGFHAVEFSPRVPVILEQIWERLRGVPGVEAAAASMTPPLSGDSMGFNFTIAGRKPPASEKEALSASFFAVSPDYFRVLKVPMVRGRDFTMRDSAAAPWVVIINQTLARRYFPNQDPLGQRLRLETVQDEKPREIVGVVGDIRQSQWQKEPQPQLYVPHVQQPLLHQGRFAEPRLTMTYMVRSAGDPLRLVPALRGAVAEVERNQPVFNIKTVEQYLAEQVQEPRVYMLLLGVFGGIAVALAAIGIYGIMAYAVTLRTHEIGIRMALGAGGRDVLKLVLRHGLLLIGVGTLLGVAASLALTRVLASFVWGITATDPLTFVAVTLVLVGAGLAACYVPARRAVRIDPMVALRYE
jgi:putative ABC transport system permease protein